MVSYLRQRSTVLLVFLLVLPTGSIVAATHAPVFYAAQTVEAPPAPAAPTETERSTAPATPAPTSPIDDAENLEAAKPESSDSESPADPSETNGEDTTVEEPESSAVDESPTVKPTTNEATTHNTSTAATVSTSFLFSGESPTSIDQLHAMEQHFAELAEQVAPATVNIQIGMAQGSGVVVSRDGYILTAAHVIGEPNATAVVTFPDGKKVKAKTLGLARRLDSGMLKIMDNEGDRFPHLEVGLSSDLKPGEWVMAVGHPGGIDPARGLVFRVGRIIASGFDKLQTDCTLVGGDSGGPLVDMNGDVIGIHSRIGSQLWDNLHAPIDIYSESWDQMDKGLVLDGNPYLGFKVKPKTNRIASVTEKGPADNAGLKQNDRIIKIGRIKTDDYDQLRLAIARLRPYQKTSFTVKRRSKTLELEVTVSEDR